MVIEKLTYGHILIGNHLFVAFVVKDFVEICSLKLTHLYQVSKYLLFVVYVVNFFFT